METLTLGVVGSSSKENERRVPIHPRHLHRLPDPIRRSLVVERGYGRRFGIADADLPVARLADREAVITASDVVLLPKPTIADVRALRPGQALWGWPHLVQDSEMTQAAIDQQLTIIAWEAMHHWKSDGSYDVHVFHMNNELAGYASVLHALSLVGLTGHYGRRLRAAVIGFGNTGRGAVTGLKAMGVHDISVLTQRETALVADPIPGGTFDHLERAGDDASRTVTVVGGESVPTAEFLARHDIVVNCVFQDTDAPLMFVNGDEWDEFAPGTLVIDVSCDTGMGFDCAVPTSFARPLLSVRDVNYYAVDHSPSFFYDSATWMISEALLPHISTVLAGAAAWSRSATIERAIEVRDGVVRNPKILSFQQREIEAPHRPRR